ncbi:MAG: NUDIX hydrolase, partial [Exilispira sp.]
KENIKKEAPLDSNYFKINISNFYEIIKKTLLRELYEETGIKINDRDFEKRIEFLGIIDEEISSVGKVHLGFVYLYKLSKDESIKPVDNEIDYYQFLKVEQIYDIWNEFEKWSILAFSLLNITKTIIYISDKNLIDHKKINFFDIYGFTEFLELIIEENNTDYFESFLNFINFEKQSKKFWYYLEEEEKFYKFKTLAKKCGLIQIKNES